MRHWEREGNFPNEETIERMLLKLQLSKKEFYTAYRAWRLFYRHQGTDDESKPYLQLENLGYGRLKKSREALLISTNRAAVLAGISKQAYLRIEKNEKFGKATLEQLATVGNALGLELVYNFRPKRKLSFAWLLWESLIEHALQHWSLERLPRTSRGPALHALARRSLRHPNFRRAMDWNKRLFVSDEAGGYMSYWQELNRPY